MTFYISIFLPCFFQQFNSVHEKLHTKEYQRKKIIKLVPTRFTKVNVAIFYLRENFSRKQNKPGQKNANQSSSRIRQRLVRDENVFSRSDSFWFRRKLVFLQSLLSLFDQLVLAAVAEDTSDTVEAGLENVLDLLSSHQIEQGRVRQFFLQKN